MKAKGRGLTSKNRLGLLRVDFEILRSYSSAVLNIQNTLLKHQGEGNVRLSGLLWDHPEGRV